MSYRKLSAKFLVNEKRNCFSCTCRQLTTFITIYGNHWFSSQLSKLRCQWKVVWACGVNVRSHALAVGCFLFTTNVRKFRLGCKWTRFFGLFHWKFHGEMGLRTFEEVVLFSLWDLLVWKPLFPNLQPSFLSFPGQSRQYQPFENNGNFFRSSFLRFFESIR